MRDKSPRLNWDSGLIKPGGRWESPLERRLCTGNGFISTSLGSNGSRTGAGLARTGRDRPAWRAISCPSAPSRYSAAFEVAQEHIYPPPPCKRWPVSGSSEGPARDYQSRPQTPNPSALNCGVARHARSSQKQVWVMVPDVAGCWAYTHRHTNIMNTDTHRDILITKTHTQTY